MIMNIEENKQSSLIIISTVMLILAILAVSLRCCAVAAISTYKFGLDDFFAILTLVGEIYSPRNSLFS